MSRWLKNRAAKAGWALPGVVLSLLMVGRLAAQDDGVAAPMAEPPLHSKVSGDPSVRRPARRLTRRPAQPPSDNPIRQVAFQEEIGPGLGSYSGAQPVDGYPPMYMPPSQAIVTDQYAPPCDCAPPQAGCGLCPPLPGISGQRRSYMEQHFGPGSVAQADCMSRFQPDCCCISNDFYASVSPASPFEPLGGDSPISFPWFKKPGQQQQPADPCGDPDCPSAPPAPNQCGGSCLAGTGWYANGSPCYLGNPFQNHPCLDWIWKHNTSQYMWENFHFFVGPQGFKSPTDIGQDGNFGLHEGLNWAMPVWDDIGLGYQKGVQALQNNWNSTNGSGLLAQYRSQVFVTAAFFRRPVKGVGVQGGLALDYLSENYYVKTNLTQLRYEISYIGAAHNEVGFWATQHLDISSGLSYFTLAPTTFQATNLYNFFVRRTFASGATGRVWAGLDSYGDGLIGGDSQIFLNDRWAISSAFNYLIPKHDAAVPATLREDLALTINLMWWPGYRTPASRYNPYRQLFSVADNTTFLIRPKQ